MNWDVTSVRTADDTSLLVSFRDGLHGRVVFEPSYFTGVFSALADPEFFRQVYIEDAVISWPGELDLAPDALHESLRVSGPAAQITLA